MGVGNSHLVSCFSRSYFPTNNGFCFYFSASIFSLLFFSLLFFRFYFFRFYSFCVYSLGQVAGIQRGSVETFWRASGVVSMPHAVK